ncbi:MAG: SHOCT domain-containing protein [Proteobacteria bacterium]|nr:SHOCT domain-containing protein [Pseudomonadota bacterium]MBU1543743.1 SHOCT domain-containing protein [Pseudomonadota bacterium]MBU2430437.1 SHOCT domain-containing protein [Pseudomonadota bacterium]MBU2481444.1 SHOCT domain-containing protein [Pseudomonadota bacterium]
MMNSGFGYNGNWFCGPGAFFPGPAGWIITLLFWGILIYLAVKLLKVIFSRGSKGSVNRLETLKDRYVQGEISEDEYHRMKAQL